jgi:copper resistance protein D
MLLKLVDLFSLFSVVLRAGTLVFQSILLGGAVFRLWVARPSGRISTDGIGRVQASTRHLLRTSALGLVAVQLLYLYVNSAVLMTTAELRFSEVVGANFFVSGCLVLAASLVAAGVVGSPKVSNWTLPVLALIVVGASMMTNHAASRLEGRWLSIMLSCIHELAAGFWIGGLPVLVLALYRANDRATRWYVTERFSRLALISVVALAASGLMMSVLYVGSWAAVLGTAYGVIVTAKATMLGALMLLGGINFLLIRRAYEHQTLARLRRLLEAEMGIGIIGILTAASLTSQPPAIDQASDTVTLAQIYQRLKPKTPQLTYRYVADVEKAVHPGREVLSHNVDGLPLAPQFVNDLIESESNHHWMGVVVLAMGLLALLARTGKAPWAEYWPLLLIGTAVFIFFQADSECWPIGWKGFWACWAAPESFQHRIAALLCVGFGAFELRVRRQKKENDPLALIFPLVCALGGALLLTHSHAISNVKANLLADLSHVPMGVIAVFAGCARWLELRLPPKDRSIPSWIWPGCFVLIGAVLLNYREM